MFPRKTFHVNVLCPLEPILVYCISILDCNVITCFVIQAHLTVIPCQTGQLHITGIKYSLTSVAINGPVDEKFSIPAGAQSAMTAVSMLGRLDLVIKGPRLNNTKAEKTSVMHGPDNRLNLDVVPRMPLLKVMTEVTCNFFFGR